MAKEMMKNMSPDQMSDLMKQAGNYKAQMEEMVRQVVADEIKRLDLISRDEAKNMFAPRA